MKERSDLHAFTGVYATGALLDNEDAAFTAHMLTCVRCDLEVRELLETTAVLGIAASRPVPPALRTAVLTGIGHTRQLAPVVAPLSLGRHVTRDRKPVRHFALTAAACLAVLTIGLGSYSWQLRSDNSDLRHRGDQIAALATAPDIRTITGTGAGGTATVALSRDQARMEFVSNELHALRAGRTYQIWLIGPSGTRSAGTVNPDPTRPAARLIAGPGDATKLVLTEEPRGGSAQPTTAPVLQMTLPT